MQHGDNKRFRFSRVTIKLNDKPELQWLLDVFYITTFSQQQSEITLMCNQYVVIKYAINQ